MLTLDEMSWMGGLWYVASPYTLYPAGIEHAFEKVAALTGRLILHRVAAFSPIVHSHIVAASANIDPLDHSIWMRMDEPLMNAASGLIVATMPGWATSYGVGVEIETFRKAGKPIVYLDPETLTVSHEPTTDWAPRSFTALMDRAHELTVGMEGSPNDEIQGDVEL